VSRATNRGADTLVKPRGLGHCGGVVRVLVVDDFAPYLDAVHELVASTPGFEPSAELGSGMEALAFIEREAPDFVLVDVHMPNMDGLELTRIMRESGSAAVVVLITAGDPEQLPALALTCGAEAVISKGELSPGRLRELWESHGPRHAPGH
jgi:DNA-binding NarL/FixJ family response regulator